MAKKVITELIDDIDGTTAEGTVTFALDGVTYEIDLSEKNAKKLRSSLAPFVENGRRATNSRPTRGNSRAESPAEARAWLKANGHDVPERGRIPATLLELYRSR
jgi:hypothetical protein